MAGCLVPASAGAAGCPNAAFRVGPSSGLPDCRAYEQVSPTDKNELDAISPAFLLPVQVSSAEGSSDGTTVMYQSPSAFPGASSSVLGDAYIASRGTGGWQTSNLTPRFDEPLSPGVTSAEIGYDFSSDLSQVVIKVPWQSFGIPGTPPLLYNLFLRRPDGTLTLLTTAPPAVPEPENCSPYCPSERDEPAYAGASSDYSHVLFEANESLTPGAPPSPVSSLYESVEGEAGQPRQVKLVGILPDGTIPPEGSQPGAGMIHNGYGGGIGRAESLSIDHAISPDGSRVIFAATADGGIPDPAQAGLTELYDRVGGTKTIEVSAPAEGAKPAKAAPAPARFQAASADGSQIFFTSSAELTTLSRTGVIEEEKGGETTVRRFEDLYRYDVGSGSLTDLTVGKNEKLDPMGADVKGVVAVSNDGSYVYFVATGELVEGQGVDGQLNLYVSHEGKVAFIATLDSADASNWSPKPAESTAYVTPDGTHLAFMSVAKVTGYNNADQSTSLPDSEVYEYTYNQEGVGPACASCDPEGRRPVGSAFTGAGLLTDMRLGTPFRQPRVLNDKGTRLFFSSPDPLVGGIAAGHARVYEYSDHAPHLLSGIAASADDIFLDASPTGDDVFFATFDPLAGGDDDNLIDIYDARVGGGFPAAAAAPAPCAGGACQGAPNLEPTPPAIGSALEFGTGNLTASAAPKPSSHRPKTKAKKKKKKHKRPAAKKSRRARHAATRANRHRAR